ncbi:hypothetical protein ROLI_033450 [Roseobacter fucihabitans]|uniref:Transposase n=1 Tax=Roseobacter fucihabitans TaxID=1537242 RepID=A0ABZ2BWZ5_9RHOB|nr:hypothetical protein [Roseobacter litoralis]
MDGRGRYLDNTFIELLWRSLKQEDICLEDIQDGFQVSVVRIFRSTERFC